MHRMKVTSEQLDREIGRRIDALLRLSGSRRSDLAAYFGKPLNGISHKISNTRGRFDAWELLAIAEWFGIPVGVLYGTEPMPNTLERPRLVESITRRSHNRELVGQAA